MPTTLGAWPPRRRFSWPANQRLDLDQEVALHTRFGALLGFLACCVAEFCARLRRGITSRADGSYGHEDFVAAAEQARPAAVPRAPQRSPRRSAGRDW
ncbi:MAG: hypothetical protein U0802_06395 [Candidatus Binatia bacterium]